MSGVKGLDRVKTERGGTVEGFTLFVADPFVFADEEIEFLVGTCDRADLIV